MNRLTIHSLILLSLLMCSIAVSAADRIILRSGEVLEVKLVQITADKVIYSPDTNNQFFRDQIEIDKVFMLYVEKQGNIYLTEDGKRKTGETKVADLSKSDVIYLLSGKEIATESLRINENSITYIPRVVNAFGKLMTQGKTKVEIADVDKSEVFMIHYKSGLVDVVTPLEKGTAEDKVEEPKVEEPQFVVSFHSVKKGETLDKISKIYDVYVEQIREWNDLPKNLRANALLPVGTQLMIQLPKAKSSEE